MEKNIFQEVARIQNGERDDAVLMIVVHTDQSTPRSQSAKMLVHRNGATLGSIGGGTVEKEAVDIAITMFEKNISTRFEKFDLGANDTTATHTGMMCGGLMMIYFELVRSRNRLIIYGCGHIGTALAPIAEQCGFSVRAIDHRPEFADPDRFPETVKVIREHPPEHARQLNILPSDSIIIVTHKHLFDREVLENILDKPTPIPRFVGMIGSTQKVETIKMSLLEKGIPASKIEAVSTPVGLDIGGENPLEIAISILSEILAVRAGTLKDGYVLTKRLAAQK